MQLELSPIRNEPNSIRNEPNRKRANVYRLVGTPAAAAGVCKKSGCNCSHPEGEELKEAPAKGPVGGGTRVRGRGVCGGDPPTCQMTTSRLIYLSGQSIRPLSTHPSMSLRYFILNRLHVIHT